MPSISQPWWLLAPFVLLGLMALAPRTRALPGAWARVVATDLGGFVAGGATPLRGWRRPLPMLVLWVSVTGALASIHFGYVQTNALRNLHARVVVVDLGMNSRSRDVIARARQFLAESGDDPTAVIAVTRRAFVVVPFTTDHRHVDRYLQVLSPEVMPVDGRAPSRGLARAASMLAQNAVKAGQIVVFTGEKPPPNLFTVIPKLSNRQRIWLVMQEDEISEWRSFAGRFKARLVAGDRTDIIREDMDRHRLHALSDSAPIRQRRDLTPWLIGIGMLLWVSVFLRPLRA